MTGFFAGLILIFIMAFWIVVTLVGVAIVGLMLYGIVVAIYALLTR